jgi:hypothetical protein
MAVRLHLVFVASCDVCGMEADPGSGQGATPREAIEDLTVHDGTWTETVDGRLVCDRSNPDHDQARGGEAPRLLAIGQGAATWKAAA